MSKAWHRFKQRTRLVMEGLSGHRVRINNVALHGFRDCYDIQCAKHPIKIIADVGANSGQSAIKFWSWFPEARIECFEPGSKTFVRLEDTVKGLPVHCHKLAMGDQPGKARLFINEFSEANSLLESSSALGTEEVEVTTLDRFAADHGWAGIDILKVDTEGFDLNVLKGASALLEAGRVAFVLTEVNFNPKDDRHCLFDTIRDYLATFRFGVLGIYDQTKEFTGEHRLRFANALFVHESVANKGRTG